MQATTPGLNRTGAAVSPQGTKAMVQAAAELTPPMPIDTSDSDADRIVYIQDAAAVGSIPLPDKLLRGALKGGKAAMHGGNLSILMDKIGERIAFERAGTRLYDALILKHEAAAREADLPPAEQVLAAEGMAGMAPVQGESAAQTLMRIRSEEQAHFRMLCEAMTQLGGDPTAQTPCADVIATASMGLMQVLTDPRTTLAQCLNAILTAELADNAGWELLIQLADGAGEAELSGLFLGALTEEQEHLATIKGWLTNLLTTRDGTAAV